MNLNPNEYKVEPWIIDPLVFDGKTPEIKNVTPEIYHNSIIGVKKNISIVRAGLQWFLVIDQVQGGENKVILKCVVEDIYMGTIDGFETDEKYWNKWIRNSYSKFMEEFNKKKIELGILTYGMPEIDDSATDVIRIEIIGRLKDALK
jgi:hypothetical protein